MSTISDQFRQAIERSGMTRYRIAKLADVPESMLSRFMAGRSVNSDALDKLAVVLGLNVTTGRAKLTPTAAQLKARARFPKRGDR